MLLSSLVDGWKIDSTSLFYCYVLAGIRFSSYHGNFMLRSTDLLALPAVDCDKAYGAQLSLEETLLTSQTVYFQVALLYPFEQNYVKLFLHLSFIHLLLFNALFLYITMSSLRIESSCMDCFLI